MPYRPALDPSRTRPDADTRAYVENIRRAFVIPSCVQAAFRPADKQLAPAMCAPGVSWQTARYSPLLGCVRKSMTLIDRVVA